MDNDGTPNGLYKFAGKTPTGSKVHKCSGRNTSACWDYISNKMTYFQTVKGLVNQKDLCRKCWGETPDPEYLRKFGLKIKEN